MYFQNISDAEIQNFIVSYVEYIHNDFDCGDDAVVEILKFEKSKGFLEIVTKISNKTGSLEEKWIFNDYKALTDDYKERRSLTKLWAKFVYGQLSKQNKTLAKEFKSDYMEVIKTERENAIAGANAKYRELQF